jgi:DNA-directed RNA polymerase specialized sigma24 family protein
MTRLVSVAPIEFAANEPLLERLGAQLGAMSDRRGFFPTLRVREVCLRERTTAIDAEDERRADEHRADLYETTSLLMLDLLLVREDLRLKWRPLEMVRVLTDLVRELPPVQRRLLLLHLCVGLSPAEVADATGLDNVQEPLQRALFLLGERLRERNFSLDDLYGGGIGPVGHVTRVLERVRDGDASLMEALAADYGEILAIAERELWTRRQPGFDTPADIVGQSVLRLPDDPEAAPRNRKELRSLVARIICRAVVDYNIRIPVSAGGRARHEALDESLHFVADEEDRLIHEKMLDAVRGALDRIQADRHVAIAPATRSLQDLLFAALVDLRLERGRAFRVLLRKLEGDETNQEIAAAVGIAPATVKRDYQAAIEYLRAKLSL